jgi:hypothetical protein
MHNALARKIKLKTGERSSSLTAEKERRTSGEEESKYPTEHRFLETEELRRSLTIGLATDIETSEEEDMDYHLERADAPYASSQGRN